ncbi:MAG: tRNA (adenosine(37)-N6)-dimethylallyltransferase MiaA [Oscillospiraceae bacterium]|nr:tRNA (adenosine(37)-N6)-dimethylallyltransferase MiaA [Oscillospiraceae bacterium]MDY6208906.1 tRNA (adenosine(37)-N6)-dimethylallyltransferase MiaA [Oscillospiraceae bacterium]
MEKSTEKIPVIVVCGPTASGKTAVGVELALRLGGEVVSADSMQIYKGLAISTAKPSPEEMRGVPHHLMDFLEPDEPFSVADYVKMARECISDIRSRGKLPIIVGGTGLYINSLIDNISFDHIVSDDSLRKELEEEAVKMGKEHMHEKLRSLDPQAAESIHPNNVIRVIRAIEMCLLSGRTGSENREESRKKQSPYEPCMIGLTCFDRQVLYDRINRRVDKMFEDGLEAEVRAVYEKYKLRTAFNAIGFKEMIPYFEGECSLEEAADKIKQESRHYAKRQLTWFRRDVRITWVDTANSEQFDGIISNCLNIVAKSKIM